MQDLKFSQCVEYNYYDYALPNSVPHYPTYRQTVHWSTTDIYEKQTYVGKNNSL